MVLPRAQVSYPWPPVAMWDYSSFPDECLCCGGSLFLEHPYFHFHLYISYPFSKPVPMPVIFKMPSFLLPFATGPVPCTPKARCVHLINNFITRSVAAWYPNLAPHHLSWRDLSGQGCDFSVFPGMGTERYRRSCSVSQVRGRFLCGPCTHLGMLSVAHGSLPRTSPLTHYSLTF